MAAALVLGADADAVWCGSRFLASQEAEAHDAYKDRVLSADVGDTAILSIYGPGWPGQAMRTIVNDGAQVAFGPEPKGHRGCGRPDHWLDGPQRPDDPGAAL
jgi:NAD(P)H-dependent flavin oxidoreductase YrpB (nitropropane dioxygenase family)